MNNQAYSALASVYEDFMDEELLKNWEDYLDNMLRTESAGKTGLDIACGSGIFTRALYKRGYSVTGIDISEEMLSVAEEKCLAEKANIRFLMQDMKNLKVFEKVDFITVVNDGLNYIQPNDLKKTFSAFFKALKNNGVLLFDFSTAYKLKNIIGNNFFAEDTENCSYLWFNELSGDKVKMDISVFRLRNDGLYEKREESHIQYAYELSFMLETLKSAGFTARAEKFLGGEITTETDRIQIIAKKVVAK